MLVKAFLYGLVGSPLGFTALDYVDEFILMIGVGSLEMDL